MGDNDYQQVKDNFLLDLTAALNNKKSSLSYIKNYLSPKPLVQKGIVQAIVIGGTNYISALVRVLPNGKSKAITIKKGKLPVFKSGETFVSFINTILFEQAEAIGLNFAFPLNPLIGPNNELDGILLYGTKEHAFKGLIGQSIGSAVRKVYFEKYQKQILVTVANDSICLTLAGNGTEDGGMILGTGFNMSLKSIDNGKSFVANLEAGNFNDFKSSSVLEIIDKRSEHPGRKMFEKTISGKYLVTYFNEESKSLKLNFTPLNTTEDLSRLAETDTNSQGELARSILERSAFFIAAALAGVYEFRKRPARLELVTEGSLFWKGYKYKENVEKQLLKLGVPKNTIKFKFVEDSSLKGAIGLLNQVS